MIGEPVAICIIITPDFFRTSSVKTRESGKTILSENGKAFLYGKISFYSLRTSGLSEKLVGLQFSSRWNQGEW